MIYGDGQTQENLYDAEGLRYGVKENGRLSGFVYHRGELLQEEREGGEISYHLGSGIEAAQIGEETYYYHQDEQLQRFWGDVRRRGKRRQPDPVYRPVL